MHSSIYRLFSVWFKQRENKYRASTVHELGIEFTEFLTSPELTSVLKLITLTEVLAAFAGPLCPVLSFTCSYEEVDWQTFRLILSRHPPNISGPLSSCLPEPTDHVEAEQISYLPNVNVPSQNTTMDRLLGPEFLHGFLQTCADQALLGVKRVTSQPQVIWGSGDAVGDEESTAVYVIDIEIESVPGQNDKIQPGVSWLPDPLDFCSHQATSGCLESSGEGPRTSSMSRIGTEMTSNLMLDNEQLPHLLPYYIVVDLSGNLVEVGAQLCRKMRAFSIGLHVGTAFEMLSSAGAAGWDFSKLAISHTAPGPACVLAAATASHLEDAASRLMLSGYWVKARVAQQGQDDRWPLPYCTPSSLPCGCNSYLFLGSPITESLADLQALSTTTMTPVPPVTQQYCLLAEEYKAVTSYFLRRLEKAEQKLRLYESRGMRAQQRSSMLQSSTLEVSREQSILIPEDSPQQIDAPSHSAGQELPSSSSSNPPVRSSNSGRRLLSVTSAGGNAQLVDGAAREDGNMAYDPPSRQATWGSFKRVRTQEWARDFAEEQQQALRRFNAPRSSAPVVRALGGYPRQIPGPRRSPLSQTNDSGTETGTSASSVEGLALMTRTMRGVYGEGVLADREVEESLMEMLTGRHNDTAQLPGDAFEASLALPRNHVGSSNGAEMMPAPSFGRIWADSLPYVFSGTSSSSYTNWTQGHVASSGMRQSFESTDEGAVKAEIPHKYELIDLDTEEMNRISNLERAFQSNASNKSSFGRGDTLVKTLSSAWRNVRLLPVPEQEGGAVSTPEQDGGVEMASAQDDEFATQQGADYEPEREVALQIQGMISASHPIPAPSSSYQADAELTSTPQNTVFTSEAYGLLLAARSTVASNRRGSINSVTGGADFSFHMEGAEFLRESMDVSSAVGSIRSPSSTDQRPAVGVGLEGLRVDVMTAPSLPTVPEASPPVSPLHAEDHLNNVHISESAVNVKNKRASLISLLCTCFSVPETVANHNPGPSKKAHGLQKPHDMQWDHQSTAEPSGQSQMVPASANSVNGLLWKSTYSSSSNVVSQSINLVDSVPGQVAVPRQVEPTDQGSNLAQLLLSGSRRRLSQTMSISPSGSSPTLSSYPHIMIVPSLATHHHPVTDALAATVPDPIPNSDRIVPTVTLSSASPSEGVSSLKPGTASSDHAGSLLNEMDLQPSEVQKSRQTSAPQPSHLNHGSKSSLTAQKTLSACSAPSSLDEATWSAGTNMAPRISPPGSLKGSGLRPLLTSLPGTKPSSALGASGTLSRLGRCTSSPRTPKLVMSPNGEVGLAPGHQLYQEETEEERKRRVEAATIVLLRPVNDDVSTVLSGVDNWAFNMFDLDELTGHRPLSTLAFALLKKGGIVSSLKLDEPKLASFLICIEDGYRENPYHSRVHAADVLRNLHVIITRGGLLSILMRGKGSVMASGSVYLKAPHSHQAVDSSVGTPRSQQLKSSTLALLSSTTGPGLSSHFASSENGMSSAGGNSFKSGGIRSLRSLGGNSNKSLGGLSFTSHQQGSEAWISKQEALTLLAMYLCAIIHDYDHRGTSNAFLIQDEDPLAILYNDLSPMENHHLAAAFTVMKQEPNNFLKNMQRKVRDSIRDMVIQVVLSTDMKQHFATLSQFQSRLARAAAADAAGDNAKAHLSPTAQRSQVLLQPMQASSSGRNRALKSYIDLSAPLPEGGSRPLSSDVPSQALSSNHRRSGRQRSSSQQQRRNKSVLSRPVSKQDSDIMRSAPDGLFTTKQDAFDLLPPLRMRPSAGDFTRTEEMTWVGPDADLTAVVEPSGRSMEGTASVASEKLFSRLPSNISVGTHPSTAHDSSGRSTRSTGSSAKMGPRQTHDKSATEVNNDVLGVQPVELAHLHAMDDELRMLAWKMAMKCADLGHLVSSEAVHYRWVKSLEEEMFRQGDLEKQRGYLVSPLMDRNKAGITKSQPGFFNVIVLPLFTTMASALPAIDPLVQQVNSNLAMWLAAESSMQQAGSPNAPVN
ncbi:hypothetical protein CEUSTIGMA_g3629.t1 [Chlamydomonas eustigma]|uniref:Phosphodiesterase n=1 Tax=Chlamydomonas eustigma TaxID=1157962 RepID=A0A250WZH4_9CHLO|nr:hypothetical protein CEUSTIGMA_g3629.t1 [Chlamydomonas eustigma]|eukprot:GAX76185.1 hypothetical protein CEUSTIGMA_g3629.t1 [Chlamydomonas eustigma]